jgi:ubiquinone/menaquinone biosynthesis C-methylase UbiE
MFDYDAEMRFYRSRFRDACDVRDGDRVLDVGCGGGQTTRDAAADAGRGSVLGVDVSERMLEHARRQPVPNVDYLLADAATYEFEPESFDVCISRFGVMFYGADVEAAYANVLRLREPQALLAELDPAAAERAEAALRAMLAAHDTGDGVLFESAAWIITAE